MSGENENNVNENQEAPLRSVHTTNLPQILRQARCSLAVSTYQAGKLVLVRGDGTAEQPVINTHFRTFKKPMGITVGNNRLEIGTAQEIWEFRNVPAVTAKLDPPEKYDA